MSNIENMSEALARGVRGELRQHNDDNEPVLLLVRKVVAELDEAKENVERLENSQAEHDKIVRDYIDQLATLTRQLAEEKERADHLQVCLTQDNDKLESLTRQRDGLKEALTLADKIICTCGYAGRPELRNGIRAAHTVISVALGKELPLHMIEEAELVKKDVLDDWPGTKGDK